MKSVHRRYFENILSENRNDTKGHCLNIGCGKYTYHHLARKMTTMDLYMKNPSGSKINMNVKEDATKRFPFKDNTFDSSLCTFFLEHVPNPKHVINEMGRVTKEDGTLVLAVPFMFRYHEDPNDYWRFTKQGLEKILQNVVEIKKMLPIGGRWASMLDFLFIHGIPKFIINGLYPVMRFLDKKEKNKDKWTMAFFIVGKNKIS